MIRTLKIKRKIKNFNDEEIEKEEKRGGRLKPLIFSFIISILFFFILIGLETRIMNNYEKTEVVVAKEMIVDGTEITKENVNTYFTLTDVDATLKTDSAFTSIENLSGYIVRNTIDKNEIISSHGLIKKDDIIEKLISPVKVSFKASDISQVVGGTLRSGDLIDISVVNNKSGKAEKVLREVYISEVFSNSGTRIEKGDNTSSAMIINVLISKENENEFNEKVSKEMIRISKTNGIE